MSRTLLFALFLQVALTGQQGTASIGGVVVKLGTDEPISGAVIELSRVLSPPTGQGTPRSAPDVASVTTSADGRFHFSKLASGEYRLVATRAGGAYIAAEYGQRTPTGPGLSISLAAGQEFTNARVQMPAAGSISGRVYDRDGRPIAHALVMALQPWYREGQRRMVFVQAVQTNDRGEYRLFWLPPGRYQIAARADDLQESGALAFVTPPDRVGSFTALRSFSPAPVKHRLLENGELVQEVQVITYYGSEIDLRQGENISAVDIPVTAGVRPRAIRGAVINSVTGQRIPGAPVTLTPRTSGPLTNIVNAKADENGVFTIDGLVPGTYHALSIWNTNAGALSGFALITVENDDVDNVAVVVRPELAISGRIIIEGRSGPDVSLARLAVGVLHELDFSIISPPRPTAPPGTFMTAVGWRSANPRLIVAGALPAGGYVKSIRSGALDILNGGLQILEGQTTSEIDVVIGMDAGTIQGRALDQKGDPAGNVTIALVPESPFRRRFDLYKTVSSDGSGRFRIADVAPGSYKVFAWEDVPKDAWTDPDFIRAYEGRGQLIHVVSSGTENVEVRPIR